MKLKIDIKSQEPAYSQIVNQVRSAVHSGALKPGEVLTPVRQLASLLNLNPNTVAKAYKMLEQERIVHGAGRQGTFVEENAKLQIKDNNQAAAKYELDTLIKFMRSRDLDTAQIKLLLFDQIEKIDNETVANDDRQISFKGEGFTKKLPSFFSKRQK